MVLVCLPVNFVGLFKFFSVAFMILNKKILVQFAVFFLFLVILPLSLDLMLWWWHKKQSRELQVLHNDRVKMDE